MSFQSPDWLIALAAVPLLLGLYVLRERRRIRFASRFANPSLLPNIVDGAPGRRRHLPVALLVAGLAAMVVGVARPHADVTVPRREATVMLAVDVSRSMRATDVRPSRLAAAVGAAEAFLNEVPKTFRVGVVSFASRATLAVPPTADRSLVQEALASLRPGGGTALGDAVALCAQVASRQRTSDGVIPPTAVLVVSDGARDGGKISPQAAARRARALRIPVYTIVLGTPFGVVRQTLTGGYTEVIHVPPPGDSRLREVYGRLRSRLGQRTEDREITDVFAGGAAALLLAGSALSMLWFRRMV